MAGILSATLYKPEGQIMKLSGIWKIRLLINQLEVCSRDEYDNIYLKLKQQLAEDIETSKGFRDILDSFSETQRSVILEACSEDILPKIIKTAVDFRYVFHHLTEAQCVSVITLFDDEIEQKLNNNGMAVHMFIDKLSVDLRKAVLFRLSKGREDLAETAPVTYERVSSGQLFFESMGVSTDDTVYDGISLGLAQGQL